MKFHELYYPQDTVITSEMLTESFIDHHLRPKLETIFRSKTKNVNTNVTRYNSAMKGYEQQLTAMGFNGKDIADIAERKASRLNQQNIKSKFATQIKEMFEEIQQGGVTGFTGAAITIIMIIFVNSVMAVFFIQSAGPIAGMAMTATFVAPITEEIGRFIHVRRGKGGQFNVLFNATEYMMYVLQAPLMGISMGAMALLRILPVIMHTLWTVIMRDSMKSGRSGAVLKTGSLHALWNWAASAGSPLVSIATLAGTLAFTASKDKTASANTDDVVAFGFQDQRDYGAIRNEIVARDIDVIMVEAGIDTAFLRDHAKRIGAEIIIYSDFSEVRKYKRKDKRLAIVLSNYHLDNTILTGGGSIKRWLQSNIRFKVIRSKNPPIEPDV